MVILHKQFAKHRFVLARKSVFGKLLDIESIDEMWLDIESIDEMWLDIETIDEKMLITNKLT